MNRFHPIIIGFIIIVTSGCCQQETSRIRDLETRRLKAESARDMAMGQQMDIAKLLTERERQLADSDKLRSEMELTKKASAIEYKRNLLDLDRCREELQGAQRRANVAQSRFKELKTAQEMAERDRLAYDLLAKHLQGQNDELRQVNEELKREISQLKSKPREEETTGKDSDNDSNGG